MCTQIVEEALHQCFLSYAAFPGAALEPSAEVPAVYSGVALPFFNGVTRTALAQEGAPRKIRETVGRFRANATPFRWWVTPSASPSNLVELLIANGFRHVYDAAGMAIDLSAAPSAKAIPGVTIRRIEDAEAFGDWVTVFGEGFSRPQEEMAVWRAAFEALGFDRQWRHFVAWLDGTAVATSSVCLSAEVAGVYDVTTLPAARGRGIGAAVTLEALMEARREGCRVASLQSSEMAFGVYRSLGFRHCCDLTLYDWRPEYGA